MPTIQLADFSAGINNAIDERLISLKTLTKAENVDLDSGLPEPIQGKVEVEDPNIEELSIQNGNRSVVKFGKHFYYSDNETGELGSSLGYIGVNPPTELITVSLGAPGDVLSGKYKYIALYQTKDGHRSPAFLPGQEQIFQIEIDLTLRVPVSVQLSDLPEWVDLKNQFLGKIGRFVPGTRVNHLGKSWILKTTIGYGVLQFFINTTNGDIDPGINNIWEDITGTVETVAGVEYVTVSNFGVPTQPEVDRITIFRTLANGDVYYFNRTHLLKDGSSFRDNLSDAEMLFNEQLTIANAFPPIYTIDGRVGGKYLTEVNERYWLAQGSRLHHSLVGDPHSWVPEHSVEFDSLITALAVAGGSIVVFLGQGTPWIVSGNKEEGNLSKVQIASNQGCPNWKTISYLGNSPTWQSLEGECVLSKQPLGQDTGVSVITTNRYKFPRIGDFSLSRNNKYFLFFEDHVVINDIVRDQITTRSLTGEYGFVDKLTGKMYLIENERFFDADSGDPTDLTIKTGKLYDGRIASLKRFEWLDIQGSERLDVSVWYDEDLVVDTVRFDSPPFNQRIKLPEQHAYMIQVQVVSPRKITNISIDYKLVEEK